MQSWSSNIRDVTAAAEALRHGALIAFPTETVYGLGADATNPQAVTRIFEAKGRPADHPLILHIASPWQLPRWVSSVPPAVWALAGRFWPGPLTLVLPRADTVPDVVTGGLDSVAIRIPDHPVALALLTAFDGALAAPSANPYGKTSPTRASHVISRLADRIDGIIDGGDCKVGIESTILDLGTPRARILREGVLTADMLAASLGYAPEVVSRHETRAPGSSEVHYAPDAPVIMVERGQWSSVARAWAETHSGVQVMRFGDDSGGVAGVSMLTMPEDPASYARALYARLRELDALRPSVIIVERPPATPEWGAVNDRLRRAAAASRNAETAWQRSRDSVLDHTQTDFL